MGINPSGIENIHAGSAVCATLRWILNILYGARRDYIQKEGAEMKTLNLMTALVIMIDVSMLAALVFIALAFVKVSVGK